MNVSSTTDAKDMYAQRLDAGGRHDDLMRLEGIKLEEAIQAYHGLLGEHTALEALWNRAKEDKESKKDPFGDARSEF